MKTSDLFTYPAQCCGCGLCANLCPVEVIKMKPDEEGFLYPVIEDNLKCLQCKKCIKYCPLKAEREKSEITGYYAGSMSDDKDTISCASGGLATAISRRFIKNNGVVYGVSYTDDFKNIVYQRAEKIQELEKFKTSKYAQSEKGQIYKSIENDVNNGQNILFIGLPCEVAALKGFMGNKENLYLVELICHGPTSVKVHRQYLESLDKKLKSKIIAFSARYKADGKWKPFYAYAKTESGTEFMEEFHKSTYGVAFRHLKRPSCNVCPIKGDALKGDLMIGDYHYAHEGVKSYNPCGVSVALVHNEKGKKLLDVDDEGFKIYEIDKRTAMMNRAIYEPIPARKIRGKFSKAFCSKGLEFASAMPEVNISDRINKIKTKCKGYAAGIKRRILRK